MVDWKRTGAVCGILGGILFVIFTFIDMLIYPGGYSFLENYFSELGLTVINGTPAFSNYVLFVMACTSPAVCSIPFWWAIKMEFSDTRLVTNIGWIGTILGFIAAPFLSALALFAGDVFPFQHGMATLLFFVFYSLAIVVYSVGMLYNSEYNSILSIVGFAVAAICLLHIFAFHTALMQKIAVYSLVLWSGFQGYYLFKYTT